MPQHTHAVPQTCTYCGGFARVAITTGLRYPNGLHMVIFAYCNSCRGTGEQPRLRSLSPELGADHSRAGAPC